MQTINFPSGVSSIPLTPGVYQFKNNREKIIYIGKAKNLRSRIKSYTLKDLLPKTARMVSEAKTLSFIEVQSEFEALLLEAKLVRKYMPVFNIELKDDKSPLYIGITAEEFPRVLTFRQTDLQTQSLKHTFGPYIDGRSAKYVLRLLRKVFPYSQHRIGTRPCIYFELGLCKPCPSLIANTSDPAVYRKLKGDYLKNIRQLVSVLSGKKKSVSIELAHEMNEAAKDEDFEKASELKKRLFYLESVTTNKPFVDEYIKDPNFVEEIHAKELEEVSNIIGKNIDIGSTKIRRIECFDIAHLSGSNPTASMVTFIDGVADKKYYRHFKINKGKKQNSDVDSMKEVLTRRAKHFDDWGKPDLMVIDGGKPQIAAAHEVLGEEIPIVGLAKRLETFVFYEDGVFIEKLLPEGGAKNLIVRLRDEAHRFARRLHHNLVTKTLLGQL